MPEARAFRRAGRGKSAPPVRRGESGSRLGRRPLSYSTVGGGGDLVHHLRFPLVVELGSENLDTGLEKLLARFGGRHWRWRWHWRFHRVLLSFTANWLRMAAAARPPAIRVRSDMNFHF